MLDGMPVGMVYGFCSTLLRAIEFFTPEYMAVTFDTKEKTFRHDMDENYKAHRTAAPDDFYPQLPFIFESVKAMGLPNFAMPGFESDDIIGTLATQADEKGFDVRILSGDLDFLQLVTDKTKLVKFNGKIENSVHYGPQETVARYGIKPNQMVDFKAIVGDSSDNYKGVPGIGPKTAATLLQKYETIDSLYENLENLKPALKEKLVSSLDDLTLCRKLAAIHTDLDVHISEITRFGFSEDETVQFFEKMKFFALVSRFKILNNNYEQIKNKEHILQTKKVDNKDQMSLF